MLTIRALLVCTLSALAVEGGGDPGASWREHMRAVGQFPCGRPQRRSLRVADLLKDQVDLTQIIVPHATVLHRCDSGSGCCKETLKECRVAQIEDIDLQFYVIDKINKTEGFRAFTVTNHTRCTCQAYTNDIK